MDVVKSANYFLSALILPEKRLKPFGTLTLDISPVLRSHTQYTETYTKASLRRFPCPRFIALTVSVPFSISTLYEHK